MATASTPKKIGIKTAKRKPKEPKPQIKCLMCGRTLDESDFFMSKGSLIWTETNGRMPICKDDINSKFLMVKERYGERIAMMICCHWCDLPWIESIYENLIAKNTIVDFWQYARTLNGPQWRTRSFLTSLVDGSLTGDTPDDGGDDREAKWSREDRRNKKECVDLLGYDPFDGFSDSDRKMLYGELLNYLDEDLLEDPFKLNMVIQIVISNNQIRALDLQMAKLNPAKDSAEIKSLTAIKKDLVTNVNNISKENEISVRNRSTKQVGKGTLTALMKDLREKDFGEAEVNFYDMLKSPGTTWAIEQSNKALMEHCLFDENDRQEIFMMQREMIQKLQSELDDIKEELRLVKVENKELRDG